MESQTGTPYGGGPPLNPSQVPAGDVRPRRVWYVVAGVLALVLAGAGAAVIVVTVKDTVDSVDTGRSFSGGSSETFSFTEGETKAIYVSQPRKGRVDCRIPKMESGSMTQPDSTIRITVGSRTWDRVFEVKPADSGDYTLTCISEQQAEFALGDKPQVGATVGGIFAAIGLFFAATAAAVGISVITAVRRGRHRRRLAAMWAPPPQWAPGAAGPPPGPRPGHWPHA
ncbi:MULTISPECIES: serine/arginine repetitive matrix protein 2 [unclassified Streptomyces]|uniref:serine/arginine repetitive matrix protein 2 n=1 Tax=unclassified Streptomyces TaxID=2593676 RepID=UPI002DD8D01E|nr:serine/arginine repetitive matrix protein 2 [Streptomyces sp. NBC_01775]WSB80219.1 serine/arginine repetitive matrix protein 2 [Streptomyces sp. NBC_01775]WSS40288.1 serine/arginine repetitive matrix protein 2 [Streptomyces sp. NBC_01187]